MTTANAISPQKRLPFLQGKMVGGADRATFKRAKRCEQKWGNIPPVQPHYVTEIDAGHETPDATRLLGFFRAIFQSENKKMHLAFFAVREESELKNHIFWGRILTFL